MACANATNAYCFDASSAVAARTARNARATCGAAVSIPVARYVVNAAASDSHNIPATCAATASSYSANAFTTAPGLVPAFSTIRFA